jgi:hypothetical protein
MPRQEQEHPEVEAVRRLLAAKQLTTGAADRAAEVDGPAERPLVSLFEPNQPAPASPIAAPGPAGQPQLETALPTPQRKRPAPRLLVLTLILVVGLGVGTILGVAWAGGTLPGAPAPPAPTAQPTAAPATSIVVRSAATPACLETARRGDQLIDLLIRNKRSQAAKLLVPYHLASRQCARDADP